MACDSSSLSDLEQQADQEALSNEAARYLEDDLPPMHNEGSVLAFGGSAQSFGGDGDMEEDSVGDGGCPCPICRTQPLFFQMGWFLCTCGFRLNVKAEPISLQQLKSLLQQSAESHCSSGCAATPSCILKVFHDFPCAKIDARISAHTQ